jgi:hypothetical protein
MYLNFILISWSSNKSRLRVIVLVPETPVFSPLSRSDSKTGHEPCYVHFNPSPFMFRLNNIILSRTEYLSRAVASHDQCWTFESPQADLGYFQKIRRPLYFVFLLWRQVSLFVISLLNTIRVFNWSRLNKQRCRSTGFEWTSFIELRSLSVWSVRWWQLVWNRKCTQTAAAPDSRGTEPFKSMRPLWNFTGIGHTLLLCLLYAPTLHSIFCSSFLLYPHLYLIHGAWFFSCTLSSSFSACLGQDLLVAPILLHPLKMLRTLAPLTQSLYIRNILVFEWLLLFIYYYTSM